MAFSKSIQKAQIPTTCDLCETNPKIQWKCINCDLLMCDQCKDKIHTKFKFAKDHKIITIKEIGLHDEELDFNNIKCEAHPRQDCCMFCKSCDKLVCPLCISQVHNGHGLVEISEGYQRQLEKLKQKHEKVKGNIDELTKEETKIDLIHRAEKNKFADAKNKMQTQRAALKSEVDKHADKLLNELDNQWETMQKYFQEQKGRAVSNKGNMIETNTTLSEIINSKDPAKVFKESQKLEESVDITSSIKSTEMKFKSMPKFLPGEITQYNFGSLQDFPSEVKISISKEFTTDIGGVGHLSTCPDGSVWMGAGIFKIVQEVKPEGNKLKVVNSYNTEIKGMAVTPSDDLLLSIGRSTLKQISCSTGKLADSIYTIDPLNPTAIHITKDEKILIGAKDPGQAFPATGRRVVIEMNTNGVHQVTYEYDRNDQPLFTYVRRITSTSTGTVFVVDQLSEDWRGRVVVLGQDGGVLNMYTGHPDINTEDKPFQPVYLVTTPSDNVIVPQLNYHFLHILNSVGHLITYYNTTDTGIQAPYSLSFTTSGQLYIGCSRAKDSTDKLAKLYQVDISGV